MIRCGRRRCRSCRAIAASSLACASLGLNTQVHRDSWVVGGWVVCGFGQINFCNNPVVVQRINGREFIYICEEGTHTNQKPNIKRDAGDSGQTVHQCIYVIRYTLKYTTDNATLARPLSGCMQLFTNRSVITHTKTTSITYLIVVLTAGVLHATLVDRRRTL